MVLRIDDRDNEKMEEDFANGLNWRKSKEISQLSVEQVLYLYQCSTNPPLTGTGFWIGNLESDVLTSYLIIKPLSMPGFSGNQAVRAWTDPLDRAKGFSAILLAHATKSGPLITDFLGMTTLAWNSWAKVKEVERCWYDLTRQQYVSELQVPKNEMYSEQSVSSRWQQVLKQSEK